MANRLSMRTLKKGCKLATNLVAIPATFQKASMREKKTPPGRSRINGGLILVNFPSFAAVDFTLRRRNSNSQIMLSLPNAIWGGYGLFPDARCANYRRKSDWMGDHARCRHLCSDGRLGISVIPRPLLCRCANQVSTNIGVASMNSHGWPLSGFHKVVGPLFLIL